MPSSTSINEDICSLKLQVQHHEGHLSRVAKINGLVDKSLPKSYGLKHLETRAKKKQLNRDRELSVQKSDEILSRDLHAIANENRKQMKPLQIKSANEKVRIAELEYLAKNNKHMVCNLEKTVSMMPTKEELAEHNARNLKQKKLLCRKFFGSILNPNCKGEKVKPITQEEIDSKPEWIGSLRYQNNDIEESCLDSINPDDYALHKEDIVGSINSPKKKKSRRRRVKSPKRPKPTYNHLKPKFEPIVFEIVNMPK